MPQRRIGKFEVWVYTRNEKGHRPHVHIFFGGAEVVIFIGPQAEVRENRGHMKIKDVREAQHAVAEHSDELLRIWRKYNA
jgi:hypothetical protein